MTSNNKSRFYNVFSSVIYNAFIVCLPVLAMNSLFMGTAAISNSITKFENKVAIYMTTEYEFFGGKITIPSRITNSFDYFFTYAPITLAANSRGEKAEWIFDPTKTDVLEGIANNDYQSIVFIGHGDRKSYTAVDENVTARDFYDLYNYDCFVKRKSGSLVKYTCGLGEGHPRELHSIILENYENGAAFDSTVTFIGIAIDAWIQVLYTKE
ncbi:hypothetical protein J4468_04410 [Candidatus Woesearchaeota archaeon]|nr:hypothetical protein [Candidatus Woesearchaeota archaeon]